MSDYAGAELNELPVIRPVRAVIKEARQDNGVVIIDLEYYDAASSDNTAKMGSGTAWVAVADMSNINKIREAIERAVVEFRAKQYGIHIQGKYHIF